MVWFQNFILEYLHHHTISNTLFFERIYEVHHARIWLWEKIREYNWIWVTPSLNCRFLSMHVHTSHRPYGHPFLTLCSWQWMHGNSWCNLWHLCYHCARCWLSCWASKFTSSILCNSKIHCLGYSSTQRKELSQSTPH